MKDFYLNLNNAVQVTNGRFLDSEEPSYYIVEVHSATGLFALGVFDQLTDSLKVSLLDNYEYTIKAKALGKGESFGIPVYNEYAEGPYIINQGYITNSFIYDDPQSVNMDQNVGNLYSKADSSEIKGCIFPQSDTYYTKVKFNTSETNSISIELLRRVFGIEARVSNMTSGKLNIIVGNDYPTILSMSFPDTVLSNVVSFSYLDTESLNVPIQIYYNDGGTEQLLFDDLLSFNRLERKIFKIDMNANNSEGRTGFKLSIEGEPLYDGEVFIID